MGKVLYFRRGHVYLGLFFVIFIISTISLYENYNSAIKNKNRTPVGAAELSERIRICCLIPYSYHYLTAANYVKRTWARHCDKVIFISGKPSEELEPYVPIINETDTWKLVSNGFAYAYNYYRFEADWFLKVTDSSFVVVENLRYFLKDYSPKSPIYFGYKVKDDDNHPYMYSQAGYVLSTEALRRFTQLSITEPEFCTINAVRPEAIEMGRCMRNAGIIAGDSRDGLDRHTFIPVEPEIALFGNLDKKAWFYNRSFYELENRKLSVSKRVISFPVNYPAKIYNYYYFIYRVKKFGISRNNVSLSSHERILLNKNYN